MVEIFDYQKFENNLADDSGNYASAEIFPHIIFEDFVNGDILDKALRDFPQISDQGWIHYIHYNEIKGGLNKRDMIPPSLLAIIDELNSSRFISYLEKLTGIKNLIPDHGLEGGGLHQIKRGGFLNIHADFSAHPHHRMWRRRVNVLLYLNKDWKEEYGGKLELWTKDMKQAFRKILPVFNRCVIFNTDLDSFHGHPEPLNCPEDRTRKSIALYYFTEEKIPPTKVATNYQARPGDGIKAIFIWLDKRILSLYNRLKGLFGINDDFASKLLKKISKK